MNMNVMSAHLMGEDSADDIGDDSSHSGSMSIESVVGWSTVEGVNQVATTCEDSDEQVAKRLSRYYPHLHDKLHLLPRQWNRTDKYHLVNISHGGLRASYRGVLTKSNKDATSASVRSDRSIPAQCGLYYYEVTIVKGDNGCLGIGFSDGKVNLNRLPGWDRNSFGYHGDDGHFFASSGNGITYGPRFSTGDVVGCGLNLVKGSIFFTKNGTFIGIAANNIENCSSLYPTVGLQTPAEVVDVNFGQKDFVFDFLREIRNTRNDVHNSILSISLSEEKNRWMHRIVASWLHTEGLGKALVSFEEATGGAGINFDESRMAKRRQLCRLIVAGEVDEVLTRLESLYPSLLAHNPKIDIMLRSYYFVKQCSQMTSKLGVSTSSSANDDNTIADDVPGSSTARFSSPSNPHKRTRSRGNDNDSDSPPPRKSPPEEDRSVSIADSQENGNSHTAHLNIRSSDANGDDHNTAMEQNSPADRRKYNELLELGRQLYEVAETSDALTSQERSQVQEALSCIWMSDFSKIRRNGTLSKKHLLKVAKQTNAAILEWEASPSESMLSRLVEECEQKRADLLDQGCSAAALVHLRSLVLDSGGADNVSDISSECSDDIFSDDNSLSDDLSVDDSSLSADDDAMVLG